jgi:hypothetical protein
MAAMQKFTPRLMDKFLLSSGFKQQRTKRPKSRHAPDNMYAPLQGYDRVKGDFSKQQMPISITNELQTNGFLRASLAGVVVGAAAAAAAQRLRRRSNHRYD